MHNVQVVRHSKLDKLLVALSRVMLQDLHRTHPEVVELGDAVSICR
jgi:hypothetical protein